MPEISPPPGGTILAFEEASHLFDQGYLIEVSHKGVGYQFPALLRKQGPDDGPLRKIAGQARSMGNAFDALSISPARAFRVRDRLISLHRNREGQWACTWAQVLPGHTRRQPIGPPKADHADAESALRAAIAAIWPDPADLAAIAAEEPDLPIGDPHA